VNKYNNCKEKHFGVDIDSTVQWKAKHRPMAYLLLCLHKQCHDACSKLRHGSFLNGCQ
jgi:hypothetical protein